MADNAEIVAQVDALIQQLEGTDDQKKEIIRGIVARHWPSLPVYTTLEHAVVEEVQKATVGSGVVLTFKENGVQKVVLVKAGTHYESPKYAADPNIPIYMIAGGMNNLTKTPGTIHTLADDTKAEDSRAAAVRECEEELVDDNGKPVLAINPSRLKPIDTKTLTMPWGERRAVVGYMLELDAAGSVEYQEPCKKTGRGCDVPSCHARAHK